MTLLHRILFGGRETGLTFCYVQSMNLWKKKVVHMVVLMKYTCNKIDCCHHLMKSCHRETDCSPLSLTLIPLRKIKCFSLFLLSCSSLHYFVSLKKNSHFEKNEVNYKNSLKKIC